MQQQKTTSLVTNNEISQPDKAKETFRNSTVENKFAKLKADDYSYLQQTIIAGMKKELPIQADFMSVITDIYQDGNTVLYKYEVKGIPHTSGDSAE